MNSLTENKKLQHYFLLVILLGVLIFTFFILRPFLYVIILALVCATIFEPMHQKILRFLGDRKGLSAFFTTIIIIIIIIVPFIFLGIRVLEEAKQFFPIISSEKDVFANVANNVIAELQKYVPFQQNISIDIDQYARQGLEWLLGHFDNIFGSVLKLLFNFLLFIIITYYVFKDGLKFKKQIIDLSPLSDSDDQMIFIKIKTAINSVIRGSLVIAFIQGALATIGFALFGVPNMMLWGIAATIASLIPGIGTSIVLMPAVLFLFLTGNTFSAFCLLVWAVGVVGLIDNLLRPILIGRQIKIHSLIVFISVIGGILFFGPIGFLLGPLTISILFSLLDIYTSMKNNRLK
ncbi:MAG: AI-2E family transporter [Candidatus Staskawiczbacteria bacterium]|nr:AI-2E family transporter [Candidatus Staskawiczbacteria bacterium]